MKKILMVANVPSMIGQFNMDNISILLDLGYTVDVAFNCSDRSVWSEERVKIFQNELREKKIDFYNVNFTRNALNIIGHIKSYKELKALIKKEKYDVVHCNTPIVSAITRIITHSEKIKCIYTAHGFHFFKGAPLINWILYYPIEKFFSKWTDVLVTINQEDYERATKKFHSRNVKYIPGVGINSEKFSECIVDVKKKRKELGIPDNSFVLLSVGELHNRKNQRVVIEALGQMNNYNIHYLIVGQGKLADDYRNLVCKYNLINNVTLLGYRTDIKELCKAVDCFVHPSVREGLGIAPIEAMASGLPLISSYVNGMRDYTEDGISGCCLSNPLSVDEMVRAIQKMYQDKDFRNRCAESNRNRAKKFDIKITNEIMKEIYMEIGQKR